MVDKPAFEPIKPADLDLTQPSTTGQSPRGRQPLYLVAGIAVLLLLLLAVIFVLPRTINPTPTAPVNPGTTSAPPAVAESPFQQAQQAKTRRQAQDLLAGILEKDDALKAMGVSLWANDSYQAALEAARQGDTEYRRGQFDQALAHYDKALKQLSGLEDSATEILAQSLATGQQALAENNEEKARQAFTTALAIDPQNTTAQQGMERAGLLPQTVPLLAQAKAASEAKNWLQARQLLEELLSVDKNHQPARDLLKEVSGQLQDQAYQTAMSQGLQALQAGKTTTAIKYFEQALGLKPGDDSARASLNQARYDLQNQQLSKWVKQAQALEADELWQKASAVYQQALDRDETLIAARVGLLRSQARATLDEQLQGFIDQPLRLSANSVYSSAQQALADARNISSPGPRLVRQTAALEQLLLQARQPVELTLNSDNQTQVTLLRVSDMGQFETRTIKLLPGRYTALGSRKGYRDVRLEFSVTPGQGQSVSIVCNEPI